ncbi:Serine-aspartate repeat-containing protein D precursor [Planctomycetes bacterium MalM25]|nr:Serine-aspartate repeat-containing protein D precursor [Planctomycetes bacterium MalM25]
MGLLSTLFGRPARPLTKAPRRPRVEACEERRLLAADVLLGSVYLEDAVEGEDNAPDTIQVSFEGGAAGTTLDRLIIEGDKLEIVGGQLVEGEYSILGPSNGDIFFDTVKGGQGSFEASGFSVVSTNGFTMTGVEVLDGGTRIAFDFEGFEAGEEFVFSVDVDEYGVTGGALTSNAFAEGAEFQGSAMIGDFSAPGFVDLRLMELYYDEFDARFAAEEAAAGATLTQLPPDDYDDPSDSKIPVRTAGAVARAPQVELARIAGFVYHDRSDDGSKDSGEEGISGVTVELLDATNSVIDTTTTASDGSYQFLDLDAGVYGVRETQPAGWFDGQDTAGTSGGVVVNDRITEIDLDWGERSEHNNFGELLAGSISGRVHAMNGPDCDFDDPDILLAGVTIELLDASGAVIDTTTTNAQGRYTFAGLRPGEYQVRETQPDGYYDGGERAGTAGGTLADDLISGIQLGSDQQAVNYDFCEHVGADLSGYVYHDRSDDGSRDPGEEPIPGVTLKLLLEDGTDTGQRAVTNASGFYQFTNLDRGKYRVMQIHPEGWIDGKDTAGTEGGTADNPGDMIREIMLDFGDDAREYNFGELLPGSISGRVHASNGPDCDFDNPDLLLSGVTIELLNESGAVIDTTTTNDLGEYRFDGLKPGVYSVRETQPAGYYDGGERAGTAGGTLADDLISAIALGSDIDAVNYDFCEHVGANLSGYVYHDRSDDGIRNASEDPIAGVTVELLGVGGAVITTTTTNGDGYYEFTNLDAGVYTVRETQPAGWFDGKDTVGSHGGVPSNDLLSAVTLDYGDNATEYNFGELKAASISGRVHASDDPDCDFDEGDIWLEGVTIELLDVSGAVIDTTTTDSEGRYSFGGLRPGEYQVREIQPTGYYDGSEQVGSAGGLATDDLVSHILLGSEQTATGYDFCEHVGADLSGYVYHDRSDDGIRGPGEEPIPGVTLKLLLEDGTDTGQRAVTDSRGFYQFTNLDRGKYRVMQIHPEGWIDGKDTAGTEGGVADNPGDMIREIMLDFGDDAREYNFGELLPGSIAGAVFSAPDGNCFDHDTADPIAGVTIELLDASGAVIDTTTTDALGEYRFDGLPPGTYSVREIQPNSHFDGGEQVGASGGVATDDLITSIVLGSDIDATNYDFCEVPPAALSGYVFIDGAPIFSLNGTLPGNYRELRDGTRTADDTPLNQVVVRLVNGTTAQPLWALRPGETPDDAPDGYVGVETLPGMYPGRAIETLTDARGYYEFLGLPSGSYGVIEIQPEGLFDGQDTAGSTGGAPSNPLSYGDSVRVVPFGSSTDNDQITDIKLTPGDFSVENNFSEVDTTPGWIPPETPVAPPVFTPPVAITPGSALDPLPLPPPERPTQELFGGTSGVGYTWHLSVINAGSPREFVDGEAPMRFASKSTDDAWSGAERDAEALRKAKWRLLASDVEDAELSESLFGSEDAIPVSGDWDGDGVTDIGVFIDGDWYLDLDGDGRWSAGDLWAQLGSENDLPVTGDWDGDGKTDIGIYGPAWPRDPHAVRHEPGLPDAENFPGPIAGKAKNVPPIEEEATSGARLLAKLRASIGQRRTDLIDHVFHFGAPGDAPVAGDWNGDGIRTIGVYRDGYWTLDTNGDGRLDDTDRQVALGRPGDTPLVGDFDGNGVDDLGVYRGGVWFIDPDGDGELEELRFAATDQALAETVEGKPIVGDWDGDGSDEPAVYSPADGAEEPDVRVSQRKAG